VLATVHVYILLHTVRSRQSQKHKNVLKIDSYKQKPPGYSLCVHPKKMLSSQKYLELRQQQEKKILMHSLPMLSHKKCQMQSGEGRDIYYPLIVYTN
jgi:hypothetical protein